MAEGLFFDGIDLESGGRSVAEAVEFAILIDADETEARLAGADVAVARTQIAVEAAVGIGSPPEGFVEGGGLLEDLQFGHGLRLLKLVYAWGEGEKSLGEARREENITQRRRDSRRRERRRGTVTQRSQR